MIFAIYMVATAWQKTNAQNTVSQKEAVKVAVNYINGYLDGNGACTIDNLSYYSTETKLSNTVLHEVHIGGYKLILSGVKSCKPVLMYVKDTSTSLLLDDNEESGVSYFLNRYSDEIMYSIDSSKNSGTLLDEWEILLGEDAQHPSKHAVVIGPLLTTKWGQHASFGGQDRNAYNYYVEASCSDCEPNKPMTGCVATALGQIMNYWKHPVYRENSAIQFDWCNMADSLKTSDSAYATKRNAVARLLSEVGLAVRMDYCFGGCNSFATPWNAEAALKNDFGYSDDAELRWRLWNQDAWKSMLVEEITQGRPIFYSAIAGVFDGHAFVVHGYNSSTDMFCVNFGHGINDTWTTIDNIGLEGSSDYTNMENAIFALTPENPLDYCDFNVNLSNYYRRYYLENDNPEPYLCVPQTATTLTSSNSTTPASWRTIPSGATSTYLAHNTVRLLPGFHAERGSEFSARIAPCLCQGARTIGSELDGSIENESTTGSRGGGNQNMLMSSIGHAKIVAHDSEFVYPNPANDRIIIKGSGIDRIYMYDLNGKPIFRWFVISRSDESLVLDVKDIPTGIYLVRVVNNDGSNIVHKLVKE